MTLGENIGVISPTASTAGLGPAEDNEQSPSLGSVPSITPTSSINSDPLQAQPRNMNSGDNIRKRYSASSQEVCPMRDSEVLQRKLAKKMEVRYMKEMRKNLRDRIKSTSLVTDCNQKVCPIIQERLDQHHLRHHQCSRAVSCVAKETEMELQVKDEAVLATPISLEGPPLQTEMTMQDLSSLCMAVQENVKKQSETRELLTKKKFYKEYIQNQILSWIQKIPIFRSSSYATMQLRNNLLSNLTENICKLAANPHDEHYDIKVQFEIEKCLCKLPLWLSGNRQDQILFRDFLKDRLFVTIKDLNNKILGVPKINSDSKEMKLQLKRIDSYERVIFNWLLNMRLRNDGNLPNRRQIATIITQRLMPLLKDQWYSTSYKLIMKGQLITILDDLPIILTNPKNRIVHLNKMAEDLANKLLSLQLKRQTYSKKSSNSILEAINETTVTPETRDINEITIDKVKDNLDCVEVSNRQGTENEICSTILDSIGTLSLEDDNNLRVAIAHILSNTGKLDKQNANSITHSLIQDLKAILVPKNDKSIVKQGLGQVISVYSFPVTSTPKKPRKVIPKLNQEEFFYMDQVSALIRAWMDTLPKSFDDDLNFKETMIQDLAGDIMDEAKLEQLTPEMNSNKEKFVHFFVFRWLFRFSVFEDLNDANPYIQEFIHKLGYIPIPNLTASQHGTRQAMRNQQQRERLVFQDSCRAQGLDILEDQISVWMNEQPTEIFNTDKSKRTDMAHELAIKLQDHLRNKNNESQIDGDIKNWLVAMVNPNEKEHIALLSQKLKDIVINLPQDATLEARNKARKQFKSDYFESRNTPVKEQNMNISNIGNIKGDPDEKIKEFISKFIELNYDIKDPMVRNAFSQLLKPELRKLNLSTRKEVFDNFDKSNLSSKIPLDKVDKQLEFAKIVSDWLKESIAVDPNFHNPNNSDREQYITDIARNIQEIDEQRINNPDQMDYDNYLSSMIFQSIYLYKLPILAVHQDLIPSMVDQFMTKIKPFLSELYVREHDEYTAQNTTTGSIQEQNLSEFVDDYIRINGRAIDDPLKRDAWSARLYKEVQRMVKDSADPATLTKAQVYNKFSEITIPTQESLQFQYFKETSDWMNNLPLLPVIEPEARKQMSVMINDLSEKILERKYKKESDPNDVAADIDLQNYIGEWIAKLSLDPQKEIMKPIFIQQLMTRIDKVDHPSTTENIKSDNVLFADVIDQKRTKESIKSKIIEGLKSVIYKVSRDGDVSSKSSKTSVKSNSKSDPKSKIVESIEMWSNALPIEGEKEATKVMKDAIIKSLYQKIGELNVDPIIYNDDLLYRYMLGIEIETQLENIPQNSDIIKNKAKLKDTLLDTILESKKLIRELSAGDNYKHKLENSIEASFPNPVRTRQVFDPGFEIYKNHLADMFILENFDHGNDQVKDQYEIRIRNEIDKYFNSAQQKNAYPLTKEQIYNELYSPLFKVQIPNELSVIKEVEEIKTKCEIERWFEQLPLREPINLNEQYEWDQILSTLAKRIREIETNEAKPDQKIYKEIMKWLPKLPIIGPLSNNSKFAQQLQDILKSSANNRKCGKSSDTNSNKGKQKVQSNYNRSNTSQIPGPSNANDNMINATKPPKPKTCCNISKPFKSSADMIIEIVEEWCNELPLNLNDNEGKIIKDNVSMKILMKLSELNLDPDIFEDDIVYNELLDDVIDEVLSNLPIDSHSKQSIPARKSQLKDLINSVKPLMKEERKRKEYKEELKNTVSAIIKEPNDPTPEQKNVINQLKEAIVEYFVLKMYHENDNEARQIFKKNVYNTVEKYTMQFNDEDNQNPLIKHNQLLCELARVPVPDSSVLKDEAEEIKLKREVEQFFEEYVPEAADNSVLQEQIIHNLSKRLNYLEKSGHSCSNNDVMKAEIARSLKKLDKDISPKTIAEFVDQLEKNESCRRNLFTNQASIIDNQSSQPQWFSLLPSTPISNQNSSYRPEWNFASSQRSFGPSVVNYEGFEGGAVLSSTLAPQQPAIPVLPNNASGKSINQSREATPLQLHNNLGQASNRHNTEVTPESLFQTPPVFERKPLYSPLRVPEFESSNELRDPQECIDVPPHREVKDPGRSRVRTDGRDEVMLCKCRKRKKNDTNRGRPFCMIAVEKYCERCGGFRPKLCGMPLSGCLFMY